MKRRFESYFPALLFGLALLGGAPAFAALNIFAVRAGSGGRLRRARGDKGTFMRDDGLPIRTA